MVVDDLLPYCRLGIEWLTVPVEDYLDYSPANLWRVLKMASLFGASISVQVLVGEARQAQTEVAAATQRIKAHLLLQPYRQCEPSQFELILLIVLLEQIERRAFCYFLPIAY